MIIQQIISGLSTGSSYALTAVGLVVIYNTTNVVNFAQGEFGMLTCFVSAALLTRTGLNPLPAILLSISFAAFIGYLIERTVMRRLHGAPLLSPIICTLGLYMIIRGLAGFIWGYDARPFPIEVQGHPFQFLGGFVSFYDLMIFVVTVILLAAIYSVFRFTMIGLAMRATSEKAHIVGLMGISINSMHALVWAVGAALGGIAGLLIVPVTLLEPLMMGSVIIKAFAAAVLGGFESIPGAIVGGLVLGVVESLVGTFLPGELKTTLAFLIIIMVLLVRPQGIMGKVAVKKV